MISTNHMSGIEDYPNTRVSRLIHDGLNNDKNITNHA